MPSLTSPTWRDRAWPDWVTLAARVILGAVILVAGALKVGDLEGSARAVRAYRLLPFDIAGALGYGLPIAEIALGLALILGLFTRATAFLGGLMMIAYIIAIGSVWARGMSLDCGCFGGGGATATFNPTTYFLEILRDAGLLLCGAWAAWHPRSPFSLDHRLFGDPISIDEE